MQVHSHLFAISSAIKDVVQFQHALIEMLPTHMEG